MANLNEESGRLAPVNLAKNFTELGDLVSENNTTVHGYKSVANPDTPATKSLANIAED